MKIHNQTHALPFKNMFKNNPKISSYLTVVTPSSTYFFASHVVLLSSGKPKLWTPSQRYQNFLETSREFFFVVWERTHEIFDLAAGLKDGSRPSALVFQGGRIYNSWISASMLTNQDRSLVMSHAVHRQTPTAIVKPASVKCVHSFTLLSTTQQPVLVDHFEL